MAFEVFLLFAVSVACARAGLVAPIVNAVDAEYDPHPQYSYGYDIQDSITGDSKNHRESRDGDVVSGQYSLIEPDGTRRIVDYTADPINGFNAVVRKEGLVALAAPVAAAPVVGPAPIAPVPADLPGSGVIAARTIAPVAQVAPAFSGPGVFAARSVFAPSAVAAPLAAAPAVLSRSVLAPTAYASPLTAPGVLAARSVVAPAPLLAHSAPAVVDARLASPYAAPFASPYSAPLAYSSPFARLASPFGYSAPIARFSPYAAYL